MFRKKKYQSTVKLVLLIAILHISKGSKCQIKIEDKVDEFTKTRSISTRAQFFGGLLNTSYFKALCIISGTDTAYGLFFAVETNQVTSTDKKTKVYLKLSNEEILTFNNMLDYKIVSSGEHVVLMIMIDDFSFNNLRKYEITKIRIATSQYNIDCEFSDRKNKAIGEALVYVRNYVIRL